MSNSTAIVMTMKQHKKVADAIYKLHILIKDLPEAADRDSLIAVVKKIQFIVRKVKEITRVQVILFPKKDNDDKSYKSIEEMNVDELKNILSQYVSFKIRPLTREQEKEYFPKN